MRCITVMNGRSDIGLEGFSIELERLTQCMEWPRLERHEMHPGTNNAIALL